MDPSLFSFALRRIGSLSSTNVHSQRSRIATLSAAIVVVLLPVFSVLAMDASRPARVRFVVQDDQGRALPGARVRWLGPRPGWPERPAVGRVDNHPTVVAVGVLTLPALSVVRTETV